VSADGGRFPDFMSTPKHAHNLTFRPGKNLKKLSKVLISYHSTTT